MIPNPAAADRPTAESLREAALSYLARYATTRTGLLRFLRRRIDRWEARAVGANPDHAEEIRSRAFELREAAEALVGALTAAGAVDDATFAAMRGARLTRSGRSRKAVLAHLARKGVGTEAARAAVPQDDETELKAALLLARRRRLGPFRHAGDDRVEHDTAGETSSSSRERAVLARAGFGRATVDHALGMPLADAIAFLRRPG